MPSICVIAGAAAGAINLRLLIPGVVAYFGVGRYAPRA